MKESLKLIRLLRPLLPQAALRYLAVIVQKDGLDVGVEGQLLYLLQKGLRGNLAVDDAVAVIFSGKFFQCLLIGADHPLHDAVADGVNRCLHAVGVGVDDHVVQLLLGEDGDSPGVPLVRVRLGQIRRSRPQGAVTDNL